ncbi:two pore domain potassium channel family protein [Castellaniella sp. GW247-6E4]|uniref:two pore domain potassium channel family protein n=1 Tax=Castellaniella sp. GW247-6E4 TaxID=3140380 RepID=UPI0033153A04
MRHCFWYGVAIHHARDGGKAVYESRKHDLLPLRDFLRRVLSHVFYALVLIFSTLCLGVVGNMWFETITWHDAVLNAALIVAGIGPFILPATVGGKIFFSFYGIFVGLVFMATLGVVLAPVAHRLLHKFHLDGDDA